jgi:hypothetical protein
MIHHLEEEQTLSAFFFNLVSEQAEKWIYLTFCHDDFQVD